MAAYWAIISTHVAAVSSPIVVTHPTVTATVTSAPTVMSAPKPIVATFDKYYDYEERYADYKEQLYWEHR